MSLTAYVSALLFCRVPRVSGDEPTGDRILRMQIECSPRERG